MKQTATIWQAVSFFSVPTLPRSPIFYLPFSTLLRTKFINNTIQKTNLLFSNVFHILSYSKILPNNRVFPSSCHAVVISVTKTKNFPQDFFVLLVRRRMASTMHHLPKLLSTCRSTKPTIKHVAAEAISFLFFKSYRMDPATPS